MVGRLSLGRKSRIGRRYVSTLPAAGFPTACVDDEKEGYIDHGSIFYRSKTSRKYYGKIRSFGYAKLDRSSKILGDLLNSDQGSP